MALQILKFLLTYSNYIKYSNNIEYIFNTNKELKYIYYCLTNLINKYQRDITYEELALYVLVNCQEKDKDTLSALLHSVSEQDTTSAVISDLIADVEQKHKAYNVALAALEVSEGRKDFSDLLVLTENLNATKSDSDSLAGMFVTNDLKELYESTTHKQGLRWRLQTLNRMLGSLRQGDFGFIFARPETGKTTFLASEVTHFATQAEGPILWFNNEEQGNKVQLRLYQAMLNINLTQLWSDFESNQQRYMERGGDRIKIRDSAAIHRREVEHFARELRPSLIIFDQLDKIKGFSGDARDDLRLGEIYSWAREIAKQYCPVIAVSQAGASGEGKRWLTMDDVANAKTAKQAEADWILGIGKTHDITEEYMRHLALSKNKLTGDVDSDPDQRHGRQTVRICPTTARYEDIN